MAHGVGLARVGMVFEDRFQIDKFITGAHQQRVGHITRADAQRVAAIFAQFGHQRAKIAVAGDDDEGADLLAVDGRLKSIQRHADIGTIFAGTHAVDLHQIDRVVHQIFAIARKATPVTVDAFDGDRAAALEVLNNGGQFKVKKFLFGPQGHIFEVNKDGNLVTHMSLLFF